MAIKIGTRVINQYTFGDNCGRHGVVIKYNSRVAGWSRIWAMIQYDNGSQSSEMKKYLIREDEVQCLVCPKCHGEHGWRIGSGYEGNLHEIHFRCSDCGYDWWIPEYLLKKMKVPEE